MPSAITDGSSDLLIFGYSDDDFHVISTILKKETGISLGEAKSAFVYSRLTKRLRGLGLSDFRDYCALLNSGDGAFERKEMIAALTTNVTKFFREPHHFVHLEAEIRGLATQIRKGRRLRIWSAACSNGQEAFSIAMTIFSAIPEADELDVKILATDVDTKMIAAAHSRRYSDDAVAAIPPELRRKWVTRSSHENGQWIMSEKLSSIITFRELNLFDKWPMKNKFTSIFCRNVAIYFEEKAQQEVWTKFVPALEIGGALYIGHSERISGPALRYFANDRVTTYRLTAGECV